LTWPVSATIVPPLASFDMNVRLIKALRFEAAHRLPEGPPGHKCARLHGHSFMIELAVRGPVNERTGWFIDYGDLDALWQPLHAVLDHNYLNEVPGLENPTSENLARWIWQRLSPGLPALERVIVHETCDARCEYEGD
jgi:6-pyruvoyltetrahydropterin/6-carboxytetrahydropterin synthase